MRMGKIDGRTIQFPQLRGTLPSLKYPAIADIKYDGELNYIRFDQAEPYTINKYGTMRYDFPALNSISSELKSAGVQSAVLVGELYWDEGKLGALYDLLSKKKDDGVRLKLFDMVELDGGNTRKEELITRREMMNEVGMSAHSAKCWVVGDKKEAGKVFDNVVKDGYEGIVVKSLDSIYNVGPCSWVKMKYKDQNDLVVVDIDKTKERIEVMHVSADSNGISRQVNVGVKASNKHKKHIKLGELVTIEHQGVLASGSLRHPVLIAKPEWK